MAWRFLAAALFVLLGAGQALSGLHFLLIQHEVCPEHGELRHADDHGEGGVVAESGRETTLPRVAAAAGHEPHDHCGLNAVTPARAVAASLPSEESTARSQAVPRIREAEVAQSSQALLSYAPKLAPPV